MSDDMKASLFSVSYFLFFALSVIAYRLDVLLWITAIYAVILVASARMEKTEKRLQLYKEDADRRGREEMSEQGEEIAHEQHITMTRGAA